MVSNLDHRIWTKEAGADHLTATVIRPAHHTVETDTDSDKTSSCIGENSPPQASTTGRIVLLATLRRCLGLRSRFRLKSRGPSGFVGVLSAHGHHAHCMSETICSVGCRGSRYSVLLQMDSVRRSLTAATMYCVCKPKDMINVKRSAEVRRKTCSLLVQCRCGDVTV